MGAGVCGMQGLVLPPRPCGERAEERGTREETVYTVRATIQTVSTKSQAMELTAILIHAEEGGFVALNPETGTTTQGETVEEAVANLKEATSLYLSEFPMPSVGHPLVTMFTVPEQAHA
jgi:predicted RNase H-like HicB family nuclease